MRQQWKVIASVQCHCKIPGIWVVWISSTMTSPSRLSSSVATLAVCLVISLSVDTCNSRQHHPQHSARNSAVQWLTAHASVCSNLVLTGNALFHIHDANRSFTLCIYPHVCNGLPSSLWQDIGYGQFKRLLKTFYLSQLTTAQCDWLLTCTSEINGLQHKGTMSTKPLF